MQDTRQMSHSATPFPNQKTFVESFSVSTDTTIYNSSYNTLISCQYFLFGDWSICFNPLEAFLHQVPSELELNFFTSKPAIVKARVVRLARSLSTVFSQNCLFCEFLPLIGYWFATWLIIWSTYNSFFRWQAEKIVKHPNKFVVLTASSSASQSVLTDFVYTRPEMELRRVDSAEHLVSIEKVIKSIENSFSIASLMFVDIQR